MTTAARPSLDRKTTRTTKAKTQSALDAEAIAIKIDGRLYSLNPADVTGSQDRKLRQATGQTIAMIIGELESAPGLDTIATFMFACRYLAGEENLDFDQLLDEITYDTEAEIINGPDAAAAVDAAGEGADTPEG